MRVLYLSRWFPFPPDNGSKARTLNLIKALSRRNSVDLVAFAAEPPAPSQLEALRPYCRTILSQPYRKSRPGSVETVLGLFSPRPRSVVSTYSATMEAAVKEAAAAFTPDVVIIGQMGMAPYGQALPGTPRILEEVELSTLFEASRRPGSAISRFRRWLTWWKHARYAGACLRTVAGFTVVSEQEAMLVRAVAPPHTRLAVVPNGVDLEHNPLSSEQLEPDTLIYSGALTYQANFEAVDFFLREIFPIIHAGRPGVQLRITGGLAGAATERLPQFTGVTYTGYLSDIRPAIARSAVSIVPLRSGGGTRLKILESLALGTPVVSTPKGAEGLDLVPGRDLLVAEHPAEFAQAVLGLLADPGLRQTLRHNGRHAVENIYDFAAIGAAFSDFVEGVVSETRAGAGFQPRSAGDKIGLA
jgi:glycosyltransferase involved in cell wall biosynthesis